MAHIPLRMCVACREMKPTAELIRITVDKETGRAEIEIGKKRSGRGAYICRDTECIKKAAKRRCLERQLGCVNAADVYAQAEEMV